jgi:hypothetical protein
MENSLVILGGNEDVALVDAVGRADDAFFFHDLDDARRSVVADAQAALEHGDGAALGIGHDGHGLIVDFVFLGIVEVLGLLIARL